MQKDTEIEQLQYEFSNLKSKSFLAAAFRSVLRNFPMLTMGGNLDATDQHLFPQCRVLITAFVALTKPEEENLALLRTVVESSKYNDRFFREEPESALAEAILDLSETAAWRAIDTSISSVASAEKRDDIEFIVKSDRHPFFDNQAALALISRKDLRKKSIDMLRTELWDGWKPTIVDGSSQRISFRAFYADDRYQFWREWHQGFVDGRPIDWELQYQIANIPDAEWEMGAGNIAKRIEEIRARFELEQQIADLKEENARLVEKSRFEIGANGGPELDDAKQVVQEIIWAPIDAIEAETKKEEPDTGVIRTAIAKLKQGISWLLTKSAENSLTFGMGWYLSDPAKAKATLQTIIATSERWLQALINLVG